MIDWTAATSDYRNYRANRLRASMTRDDLIKAVPLYEYQGRKYVCVEDVPEPWRQQFAAALTGSACALVPEKGVCAFPHDWDAWVRNQWYDRPGPTGLD